ncbi:hypothetical protein MJO29_001437 [Puccinia striiformis f. sp. tritici]|nr:hypothetical protein MJO29_001437 [Puccinia striiformis f. sp. tritici]
MVEKPPKINEISLKLSAEYLQLFTIELIYKSTQVAQQQEHQDDQDDGDGDGDGEDGEDDKLRAGLKGLIQLNHLQHAAPGVLLDF